MSSISFASGKGGTGKTTLTLNIGAALALQGRDVVLVDGDFLNRSLTLLCDVKARYGFADLFLDSKLNIDKVIFDTFKLSNLRLIPSTISFELFTKMENMIQRKKSQIAIVKRMKEITDCSEFVLIDTPAGISREVLFAISTGEKYCLVTETGPAELEGALLVKSFAQSIGLENRGVILNRVRGDPPEKFLMSCERTLGKVIGKVPFDVRFIKAFQEKSIFYKDYPNAPASKAIREIAEELG